MPFNAIAPASINVIGPTCTFPTMSSPNVCYEKGVFDRRPVNVLCRSNMKIWLILACVSLFIFTAPLTAGYSTAFVLFEIKNETLGVNYVPLT